MNVVKMDRRRRVAAFSLAALGAAVAAPCALAQSVILDASICDIAWVSASGYSAPTPYVYSWVNAGSMSFTQFCPVTGGTAAQCGIMCWTTGNGSITVSVFDGSNNLLGTDVKNFRCVYDQFGALVYSPDCS